MSFVLLLAICWMADMRCSVDAFKLDSLTSMLRIRLCGQMPDGQFTYKGKTMDEIVSELLVWPID